MGHDVSLLMFLTSCKGFKFLQSPPCCRIVAPTINSRIIARYRPRILFERSSNWPIAVGNAFNNFATGYELGPSPNTSLATLYLPNA